MHFECDVYHRKYSSIINKINIFCIRFNNGDSKDSFRNLVLQI